jgi:5-methylcytosine-specific restriction endonuclease McrA
MRKKRGYNTKTLDKLWSKKVRELAENKCEICRDYGKLQAHHIVPRSIYAVRWDTNNGVCLCPDCHTKSVLSAHKNPIWFLDTIRFKRGDLWWYLLLNDVFDKFIKWYDRLPEIKKKLLEK